MWSLLSLIWYDVSSPKVFLVPLPGQAVIPFPPTPTQGLSALGVNYLLAPGAAPLCKMCILAAWRETWKIRSIRCAF
jgi:hypothetical protein